MGIATVSVLGVRAHGPLAAYADAFACFLASQGYAEGSTRLQVHLIAQVSRWLDAEGLDASSLSALDVDRFIAARRARVRRLDRSRRALDPLVRYLIGRGVLTVSAARPAGPVEVMLTRYRRYLLVERGVTKETARLYVTAIRPFVASFERAGRLELERVTGGGVSAFVLAEAQRRRGTSVRSVATALRSLLGFLQLDGVLQESLTGAVPGVGAWRLAGLPSPLERGELRRGRLQPG